MKISGFSFARNADTLYYPVCESIKSILPLCDEFVIAIGKGDPGDLTRDRVADIGDPRIRIIDTEWSDRERLRSGIYSQQTNIALRECSGDWCFYIQGDEAVHEQYLPNVRRRCEELLHDAEIQGLLLNYRHFWGDYHHFQNSHRWYPAEIRVVRNDPKIESIGDAQSFRRSGEKLRVARVDAEIFHYGYVRPPRLMQTRNVAVKQTYRGSDDARVLAETAPRSFDYGPMDRFPRFQGTHPEVMQEWIGRMDWQGELQQCGRMRTVHKHDRLKYRIVTWIEQHLMGGRRLGGYRNYRMVRR